MKLRLHNYGQHPFSIAISPPDPDDIPDWSMFRFLGLSLGPWWLLITAGLLVWERLCPERNIAGYVGVGTRFASPA